MSYTAKINLIVKTNSVYNKIIINTICSKSLF